MTTYTSYDLVEFGKPLQARDREVPEPSGTQVLLRVRRAGVCHSDLHIQEGFFDLGDEGKLRMQDRGMILPMAMGHEILGEVIALGPDADPDDAPVGAAAAPPNPPNPADPPNPPNPQKFQMFE